MSIVSSKLSAEKSVSNSVSNFLSTYQVIKLLAARGGYKQKGIAVKDLFVYILTNVFRMGSFYMQQQARDVKDLCSTNTYYRFLSSAHIN